MFAGWKRDYCWCIAVYFEFLAWKALHCALCLYDAALLVFRISAMNVHDIDTYSHGVVVNFQRSDGNIRNAVHTVQSFLCRQILEP